MPKKSKKEILLEKVSEKFSGHEVEWKNESPNGSHFLLKKDGETKHLKLVKRITLDENESSEIELLKAIDSEHVVKLEESGDFDSDTVFMIFPHINGRTLDKLITEDGWEDSELLSLAGDVMLGISDMNVAGVTHRDIKPKNIIKEESSGRYVILDLGIGYFTKPHRDNAKVPRGSGSRYYSAPEQFWVTLNEPYRLTSATDQFSLAVILYQLASNIHPFINANANELQNYASAVTGAVNPQPLASTANNTSEDTAKIIERMMQTEPSKRYLDIDALVQTLRGTSSTSADVQRKLFLKLPNDSKQEFVDFISNHADDVDGVIVSCSDQNGWSEAISNNDVGILFDPKTYNLVDSDSNTELAKCLDIPESSKYTVLKLSKMRDQMVEGVYDYARSVSSDKTILPYFNVIGPDSEFLELTLDIWSTAKAHLASKGKVSDKIYGGLIISQSLILDHGKRARLMSQLMGNYQIDGVFVIFENSASNISTTVDPDYLTGLKEFMEFFESAFDDVIVHRTDISVLPLINKSSFAIGWAKSARHFSVGGGRNTGRYKMKYYAPKLFTFIEEKSMVTTIISSGGKTALECDCGVCEEVKFLEASYTPDVLPERAHFLESIIALHNSVKSLPSDERASFFEELLSNSDTISEPIRSASGDVVGRETIPSYEGLISLIDN
jgi:serine/threonine protein kinase